LKRSKTRVLPEGLFIYMEERMTTAKYTLGLGRILKDGRELFTKDIIKDLQRLAQLEDHNNELKVQLELIELRREEDVKAYAVILEERDELLDAQVALMKHRIEQRDSAGVMRPYDEIHTPVYSIEYIQGAWKVEVQGIEYAPVVLSLPRPMTIEHVELTKERDELLEAQVALMKERNSWKEAIAGHSVENVKEIIGSCPTPQVLEGKRLAQEFTLHSPNGPDFIIKFAIISTDEDIEWIEDDDITDAMIVKAGGRVPCQVRDFSDSDWYFHRRVLLCVSDNKQRFTILKDGRTRGLWKHCRIKKSDLC